MSALLGRSRGLELRRTERNDECGTSPLTVASPMLMAGFEIIAGLVNQSDQTR